MFPARSAGAGLAASDWFPTAAATGLPLTTITAPITTCRRRSIAASPTGRCIATRPIASFREPISAPNGSVSRGNRRKPVRLMPAARLANTDDLSSLLALFAVSEVSRAVEPRARAEQIWQETLARDGVAVFVSEADARIVSTRILLRVPTLPLGG